MAAALEQPLQDQLDLEAAFLSCSTPSARFSKSTNTAVVSSSRRNRVCQFASLYTSRSTGREGFRERRDERGPCGGADVLLIHLELDAGVRRARDALRRR